MEIGGFGVAVRRAETQGEYITYEGLGDAAILQIAYQLELLEGIFYAEGVEAGLFVDAFLESVTAEETRAEYGSPASSTVEDPVHGESEHEKITSGPAEGDTEGKETVEAVLPEDVLSEKDLDKPPPKYEDWYEEGSDTDGVENSGTTAGAIPIVKPLNLGRDPGGLTTRRST